MFQHLSLHKKILFSNLLASFIFLSLLTLVIYYSNEHLESQLLDIQVSTELESIKNKLKHSPDLELPRTAHLSVYLNNRHESDPLPLFIQDLKIGTHHEFENNKHSYQITVEPYGDYKIYILYDITAIEESDNQLCIIIFSSWLLLFTMMVVLSNRLSYSISKPIQKLSEHVSNINPDQRGVEIKGQFKHAEINNIAQAFNLYLDKMDDYVTKQMAFSPMASHELRSPLTVIQTSADLIGSLNSDASTQEHVNKILRSTNNMAQLVHALLMVTRDKHAELERKSLNIKSIVGKLIDSYLLEANNKQCHIVNHVQADANIIGDETLLTVVLSNLIKNAIKFNRQSNIDIKFNDQTLEVIDDGQGIETQNLDQIFNFKFKGNNSQGFGIGLYISKLICDHQNWFLEIVKNKNQGITVRIKFN